MNRTELHPLELAIVAALVVAEALLTLLVAAAALVVALPQRRPVVAPAAAPAAEPQPVLARPTPHPLAGLADRLAELPVTTLRTLAGTRSKRIRKADLIAMVAACS